VREGRFEEAVAHFAECIRLDPGNEVYRSNRAAAYTSLKRYEEALADSKEVVRLKPEWPRGWARLGAAYFGLKLYAEVTEVSTPDICSENKVKTLMLQYKKGRSSNYSKH
jgi:tetratricopeptide (TPR) repeat protein